MPFSVRRTLISLFLSEAAGHQSILSVDPFLVLST
jgi:hypothetical protein